MEDKDSKNKKNMGHWKIVSFDFASLYPNSFTMKLNFLQMKRRNKIKKIWKREFTNIL
jgi:hypothetical protein